MKQSRTYRRGKEGKIDPNSYRTYRIGVAGRIIRRHHGHMRMMDAWQLAAIPAFILWLFRGPVNFFKRRKVARRISKKMKSNSIPPSVE